MWTAIRINPTALKIVLPRMGALGLIGVRLDTGGSTNGIWSPLPQLPGNYSNGFIIHGKTDNPSMTIGLTAKNSSDFAMQKLSAVDQKSNNIAPYYLWSVSYSYLPDW